MSISTGHISSLILIAGISGAGKSTALHSLSDLGYYAIENLPVPLFDTFIEFSQTVPDRFKRTALLLDIFSRDTQQELLALLQRIGASRKAPELLFLDCRTETLLKRYSETRRPHPGFDVARDKSIADAIERERNRLMPIKERATFRIDTSEMNIHDLRRQLKSYVDQLGSASGNRIRVNFLSFGYKYGIPLDCDLVVDVRFLPNPYFVEHLREKTGLDEEVRSYLMEGTAAAEFIARYADLINYLLPKYGFEGKSYLNVGIGCTGGRHRSVVIAEMLSRKVSSPDCLISVKHRDVDR